MQWFQFEKRYFLKLYIKKRVKIIVQRKEQK